MSSVVDYQVAKNIAVITIDNPPVNALSQAVRQGLIEAVSRLNSDAGVQAGVLVCAGRTFIAGADIAEFDKPPLDPLLPEVVKTIESSNKIILAAIHGTALGGGFETAMACHYRCAAPAAKVGLPEVKLGLLPGATGTQRLPRLIGIEAAIDWMISGKQVAIDEAVDHGAVDRLISGDLLAGALEYADELLTTGATPVRLSQKTISTDGLQQEVIDQYRKKIDREFRGYFSPQKIIDCVEACLTLPYEEAIKLERQLFNECKASTHSSALRKLFFAERQAGKVPGLSAGTAARQINTVAVIGAGTMGSGITVALLNAGYPVYLTDLDESSLDAGVSKIKEIYQHEVVKGNISGDDLNERLSLLTATLDRLHLKNADLFLETITEDLESKRRLLHELDAIVRSGSILASNTSTLDINLLAGSVKQPENMVGMHFFAPAHKMQLLEIVRSDSTADDVLAAVLGLAKRAGKVGVVVRSGFGFVGNRVFLPYLREAQLMVLQGQSPARIDSVAYDWGFPMGPLSVMDLSGLDVFYRIYRQLDSLPGKYAFYPLCNTLYEAGRMGRKNHSGFYEYRNGEQQDDPAVMGHARQVADSHGIRNKDLDNAEIIDRLVLAIINEAAYVLQHGVATRAGDIDVVLTNGYGFPRYRGGPLCYADSTGLEHIHDKICEYDKYYERGIWTPSDLLIEMTRNGQTFYST